MDAIEILKKHNLLKVIDEELDIYLEIPHIAYVEVKQPDSKAILFTNPIDKKTGKKFDTPVLMNIFCSHRAVELIIGDVENIASRISELLHLKPPVGFMDKLSMFGKLFDLKIGISKKTKTAKGECQQIIKLGEKCKTKRTTGTYHMGTRRWTFYHYGASLYHKLRRHYAQSRYV